MYPFLESIRLEDNKLHFMREHEARFVRTQQDNWGQVIYKNLNELITTHPDFPKEQRKHKCRVVYSPEAIIINFIPYTPRTIIRLQPVSSGNIQYPYKSTDRTIFEELTEGLDAETEILIFKNGFLTDSSFSNLALYDGSHWWTPKKPLLHGVHRSHLLKNGILRERDITGKELPLFQKIRLINAMMAWEDTWELPISVIPDS